MVTKYVRLLSYENACNVIDFVNKNNKNDYAHITPGGVAVQIADGNFEPVENYIKTLGVRYEINDEQSEKTNQQIINTLKDLGII